MNIGELFWQQPSKAWLFMLLCGSNSWPASSSPLGTYTFFLSMISIIYTSVLTLLAIYWLHCRGCKMRLKWFLLHWILGTIVSIVGIRAYKKKTSSSRDSSLWTNCTQKKSLWTILFTALLSCLILSNSRQKGAFSKAKSFSWWTW